MDLLQQKQILYKRTFAEARGFGLTVSEENSSANKPWGAYIRIAEESLANFYMAYWEGVTVPDASDGKRLDPKILIVAPRARLSLQHHARRGEHWRVLDGPVHVVQGTNADTLEDVLAQPGDVIRIPQGNWHRLVGADTWGRIAEIWEHTDPQNPSDENDITREQDDYGR